MNLSSSSETWLLQLFDKRNAVTDSVNPKWKATINLGRFVLTNQKRLSSKSFCIRRKLLSIQVDDSHVKYEKYKCFR